MMSLELAKQIQKINLDTTRDLNLVEELGDLLQSDEFSKEEYDEVATLLLKLYAETGYEDPIKESALNALGFVYENCHLLDKSTINKIDEYIITNLLNFKWVEYSYLEDMLAYMQNPIKEKIAKHIERL